MAAKKKKGTQPRADIRNSKVGRKYFVEDKYEAGIVLRGTEVKAIRDGKAQISDGFVRIEKDIPIMYGTHIEEYEFGNVNNHNPKKPRKLLLNKKEIYKLRAALEQGGYSLIPTRMYFKKALVKVEIALCKGKKLFDKREDIKKKTMMREAERSIRHKR